MQNCITSASLLSFLLIFGVRPSAAQTKAPSIYNAYTGTDVKVVPPPPALGPANSVITDPTFGSRILRVTDANTKGGESFISTDSGFSRAWNANSTAIKLTGPFGDGYWMEFNPSTFQAGTGSGEPVLHPVSFGATWEWSAVQPNIIYYLSGSTIETYNTTSGASTPVASTPTGDPVAYMATVIGLDNWVCAAVGAGPQDTYTKIFCVSPSNPSLYKFIDVVNKTINGIAQSSPNWPTSAGGETIGIHDISGGTGPNWLEVTFHQQSWGGNGGAVFDLSTNTWSLVTNADPYWSGHVSMGNGRYENSSGSINGNDSRGTVLRDPDNLMNSSEYLFVMQPFAPWNGWCDAEHSSWLNSLTNPNAPILDSRYSASTACQFAWSDEIVAAAVDGSNTVWRFAHNFNGGSLCYYAQAFAQISNDGNWALFSSYWGGRLGPDKSFGCATRIDTFIVDLKDAGLPTANSVSPNSGAGASQVFTFRYSSVNGSGYLSTVYGLFNGSLSAAAGCYVYYVPASNALYLYNDAGSAVAGPLTAGSGGTLSNSQCTLNGSGSSATGSGNTLALALSIGFKAAFAGQQNVYGAAVDDAGNESGWQTLGTWNSVAPVNTPPTANSVSPSSGTGSSQVFTFRYSSVNGSGYLSTVYGLFNGSLSAAAGCYVYYVPASNALYLYNDAGSAVAGPLTAGSGGTLSNSQCTLNGSGSSATGSGNTLALALSIGFKAAFAGQQNVYGAAVDDAGNESGWQTLGTWNSVAPVNTPPTANLVSPSSGTGSSQVFTFRYSSVNGSGYLSTVYGLFNGSLSAAAGCYVYYVPASNALYLYNDAGSAVAGPLTAGSGGTLSNSQCTLNGSGSSATGSGNTLALALSIGFKAAFAGQQNVYGAAVDDAGNESGWQTLGTWNSVAPVNTPPTANSVSPSSGTGSSQVFTFRYSSVNGSGYLSTVYGLFNGSLSAAAGCYVYYVPASNALYLYNDAGSAVAGPLTAGSGGTLSNSQCTLNGSGSSATGSGNTLALALSIGFKAAFAGQQNVYGAAVDDAGNESGWQTLGTWNSVAPVNTPPTANSVSPSSGTGSSQVFTFRYSSVNGSGYLSTVYGLFNGSLSAAAGCYVYYVPASNALYLYNDAGSAVAGPLAAGSGGTLSNSQCTLNGSGSSATGSGNTLALALSIGFKAAFAGQQNVYGAAVDDAGNESGWQTLGTWNSVAPVNTPPTANSVSPSSGTGSSQVFTFRYSSVNGSGYLSTVYGLFNGSLSAAAGCYVYYVPASNALYLYNDAGSAVAGPLTAGSGGTLSNSQCTLNGSGSSATGSGNTLALALSIGFKAAFAGQQNVYGAAVDDAGNESGWQTLGTWNSVAPVNTPPTANSVSPSSGTGSSQVFTFRYSSVNGSGYLSTVYGLFNGSLSAAAGCYVYYVPASNALYLYNDAGSAVAGPLTAGSGGTLSNSQCTLNGSGSSATGSGNTLALALSIGFKAAFAGQQNVYGAAVDDAGNESGWQTLGTWNSVAPVNTPPTANSVSPSSGTGSSQVFTFRYSSVNGSGYLSTVYGLFNGSLSAAAGCYVYYVPASNALYLYNDAGSAVAGPLTAGSGGTLSNSQCTLNGSGSSATGSGNTLALALSIGFKAAFAGQQNVYGAAVDDAGNESGWQTLGTWNSVAPVNTPPTANLVSPSSGTGSSQVFTFRYSSVNGSGYLSTVYGLFNGSLSAAAGCYVYYVPASNALYLYNDAGSAVAGPLTAGSGGTLSNSQCTLNGSGSSATGSGNTLALALSIGFKAAFAGQQNVYGAAVDDAGNESGWQTLGTWNQAAGLGAITVSTVAVGQGLQVPMMITFNPAPTFGVTDPVHGCDNPTTPGCLTVSSSNAAVMIQGHSGSSTQVVVPVAAGTTSLSLLVQAIGSPGATSTITASSPGYTNGTATTTIAKSGFVISGPNSIGGDFMTFQGVSTTLTVYAARLDANNLFVEPEEVMANVTVPIAVVPNTIGAVSPASLGFLSGTSSTTTTFQASGVNTGGATVMLTQPSQPFQFTTPATGGSLNVTVTPSGFTAPTLTIGQNLEVPANISITGNASSATTITLTSSDTTRLQFACLSAVEISKGSCTNGPASTTTPTASGTITVSLPQNQNQSANFNAIGSGAPGSVSYTISGGSFGSLPAMATVVPSELVVQTNSATLGESPQVTVSTAAVIGGAPVIEAVALNQTVTVTVTSSALNVGTITNPTVTISGGSSSGTTFFQPATVGTATITATAPGFASGTTQQTVTNGATLNINNQASLGQFLENQNSMTLGTGAPSGGLQVTLSVAAGSIGLMQLAVNPTDPGSNSIVVTVPAGAQTASYYVYALQPSGTATYGATAPGFGSAADTVTLAPSGVDIFETTPQGSPTCAINCSVSLAAGAQTFSVLVNQLSSDGNNTIVEQQNLAGPTGSSAAATTGTASSGSTALIVASGTGLATGQLVIGSGIAPGTFLVSGGGTSWVLSQATISALSSTSLAFYNAGLSVTVNDSNQGAGTLSSGTAIVTPGTGFGPLTFTPVASGSTTLSVTQPNGFLSPGGFPGSELTQVAVTVGP